MSLFLTILAFALLPGCVAALLYWIVVWFRVRQVERDRPTVRAGLDLSAPATGWPRVSVVIPAHNEKRVIDACAASLRKQDYPNLEVIFVLDRCTDETRDLLRPHEQADSRIVVIENDHCPADWAGKCHAAQLGASRATGEWLLFTDADTEFHPALCRASVATALHQNLGLLSLLSTLTHEKPHELIAQPVAGFNLMRIYPIRRVVRDSRTEGRRPMRPFANGQFMLFSREWYEKIGRHEAVREDLLEDLALARRVHEMNGRLLTLLADGMLRCSMYDSMAGFKAGWKRIFIEACNRSPRRLRRYGFRVLINGVGAPIVQIASLITSVVLLTREDWWLPTLVGALLGGVAIAGIIMQGAALVRLYRLSAAPIRAAMFYPAGCWILSRILFDGARDLHARRPVRWGGRQYILEPRA
ncbi:MAG TPA: glycosyltransferase family 2 protein [Phycisphaerales bacterium]|nr:glycosyltransferase family 2 protein [Phycisphaerales bacterium]